MLGLHHQGLPSLSNAGFESLKRPHSLIDNADFGTGPLPQYVASTANLGNIQSIGDLAIGSRARRRQALPFGLFPNCPSSTNVPH
jgi:hypothetical protein